MNTARRRWRIGLAAGVAVATLAGAAKGPEPSRPATAESADAPTPDAVPLGDFRLRELRAAEGTTIRIAFTAYAAAPADQAKRLRKLLKTRRHRVRDAILTAVRLCEQHDFQEPGLERFRRRIWLRLDQTCPELGVEQLLIGGFEYMTE